MNHRWETGSAGIEFPERRSDASGKHPAWYPWVINTPADDNDSADPIPMTDREKSIGTRKPIPWWPF